MTQDTIFLRYPKGRSLWDLTLAILATMACAAILIQFQELLLFFLILVLIFLASSLYMFVRSIIRLQTTIMVDQEGITQRHFISHAMPWNRISSLRIKRYVGRKSYTGKQRVYETLTLVDDNGKEMHIDVSLEHYKDLLKDIGKQKDLLNMDMDRDTNALLYEYEILRPAED